MLFACDKLLDIKPKNDTVEDDVLKNASQIQLLLNSAYDALRNDKYMGGSTWLASELLADNLESGQLTDNYLALFNRSSTLFNDVSRQIWNHAYIVIYRANLVLESLDKASGIRPEELASMRGQALFLRAYCHFQLVRLFAQPWGYTPNNDHLGIPIRTETTVQNLPRSTVEEVYFQIINDLNISIQELPASQESGKANVWTAKALMAQIFFQKNDFFFALKFSKDVVENSQYTFLTSLGGRFAEQGSTEGVLELINEDPKSIVAPSGKILHNYFYSLNSQPLIYLSNSVVGLYQKNASDKRYLQWVLKDTVNSNIQYYTAKFNTSNVFRVPIIQLTEIKLIYAESAAEQNDLQRSAIQINDIRKRAGLSSVGSTSKAALIAEAREQRRLEMCCEGNRLHDIRRMAVRDNQAYLIRLAPWNCNGLVLAIPDDEVSANPKIVQNPSGGCN